MSDKLVIYCKQAGETHIPVTVRIEWLPDGKIKPLTYWTPDGVCYSVKHIFGTTHIAHLRDRGVGIRCKVISEVKGAYSDHKYPPHEAYLYFADSRFCGQNFIDNRYGHDGKEYIPVTLDVFPDGGYELVYFKARGVRYMVEKTLAIEPRASFHAGGIGIWHKVEARQINDEDEEDPDLDRSIIRTSAIYFEVNKWFVSVKDKEEK